MFKLRTLNSNQVKHTLITPAIIKKLYLVALTSFFLWLMVESLLNSNFAITNNLNYTESDLQKVQKQLNHIKKSYILGIHNYNNHKFKLAEKEFTEVLKPVLSKEEFRTLDPQFITKISEELLDSIYHIGLIYLDDTSRPSNYAKAAAIFQYCSNFVKKYGSTKFKSEFFIKKALSIERAFLQTIGGNTNLNNSEKRILEYQNTLQIFRNNIIQKTNNLKALSKTEDIPLRAKRTEKIYNECSEFFVNNQSSVKQNGFIQKLLNDCHQQLGGVPKDCEYTIIGLGSLAHGTITPWSDLEFAVLIGKNNESHKQYFRNLAKLLHIKVVNLGETQLRWVGIETLNNFKTAKEKDDWFWDDISKNGFSLDGAHWHACETPLGRQNYKIRVNNSSKTEIVLKPDFELILTPSKMAEFQKEIGKKSWFNSDMHLVQSLRSVSLIQGSQNLLNDYRHKLNKVVKIGTLKNRSIKILNDDVINYYLKNIDFQGSNQIDVKKNIYRSVDRIIHALGNYYNILPKDNQGSITSWEIVDQLYKKNIISMQGAQHLKQALSIAAELRLETYYNNFGSSNKEAITDIPLIFNHFYRIMTRVQDLMIDFCNSKNSERTKQIMKKDNLYY